MPHLRRRRAFNALRSPPLGYLSHPPGPLSACNVERRHAGGSVYSTFPLTGREELCYDGIIPPPQEAFTNAPFSLSG